MDLKFISPYTIIMIIGIFGFILNILLSIFMIIIGEKCDDTNKTNIYCYASILNYKEEWTKLDENKFWEIICTIFYIVFNFLNMTCDIFVIFYLNPNYILMSDNIFFEIVKIYGFDNDKNILTKFIISQIAEFLEFIGCLIYLEIIELRFCELDKNIKINIIKREKLDINASQTEPSENDEDIENILIESNIEE